MGTPFSNVIDMTLVVINDYKLNDIAPKEPELFEQIMTNYLKKSIPKFVGCLNDLSYDITTSSFNSNLSMKEIDILADLTVLTWWDAHNNDVLVFQEPLRDADFNRYATGQNLARRIEMVDGLREKVRQDITDYQLETNLNGLMGV